MNSKVKTSRIEELNKLKAANLKILLSDSGLSISGSKSSLIRRILDYEKETKVSSFINLILQKQGKGDASTKKQKRDIKKVNGDSLATEMKTKVSAYILFTFIETKKK